MKKENELMSIPSQPTQRKTTMRHRFLGSILVCLTLAAGVVTASAQALNDEILFALLTDIGVTEAELMQFSINLEGVMEPHQRYVEENKEIFRNPTREDYVEFSDRYFDYLIFPMVNNFRTEAANFFTEDQHTRLMTLCYHIAENFPESFKANEIPIGDWVQLFILPDIVPMTEAQLLELGTMQREVFTEIVGIDVITKEEHAELYAEQKALFEELEKAETEEEKAVLREKFSNIMQKTSALMREPVQKTFDKMKTKLNTLLTAEQKAKLAQIKQDIPDYLKQALAEMKKTSDESEPAWRPGANSWVPGMGAPKDWENYPREAPRIREPRGERRFPGTE